MAGVEGFEPSTHGLEGRCSIQLSYTPGTGRALYRAVCPSRTARGERLGEIGVAEGSRTPHLRSHNPVLYPMSYGHHRGFEITVAQLTRLWRISWSG